MPWVRTYRSWVGTEITSLGGNIQKRTSLQLEPKVSTQVPGNGGGKDPWALEKPCSLIWIQWPIHSLWTHPFCFLWLFIPFISQFLILFTWLWLSSTHRQLSLFPPPTVYVHLFIVWMSLSVFFTTFLPVQITLMRNVYKSSLTLLCLPNLSPLSTGGWGSALWPCHSLLPFQVKPGGAQSHPSKTQLQWLH